MTALEDRLRGDGFAVVPGFLSRRQRWAIARRLRALEIPADHGFFASPVHASGSGARAFDLHVRKIVGRSIRRHLPGYEPFMVAVTSKGERSTATIKFHQDWTYTDERVHRPIFLWCPLVDVDATNGTLHVVPGSHRWTSGLRPSRTIEVTEPIQDELQARSVPVALRAGEVLAFDPAACHGSMPNLGPRRRPAITIAVAPTGADLVHFHLDDDGVLEGYDVDDAFFTTNPYGTAPIGRPPVEAWADPITTADLERGLRLEAPVEPPTEPGSTGRVPVYAIWHPETGPLLALGMLTAAARAHDALAETYEIRRPETAESFLADLADRTGPAVLLCSDYVWTLENNLEAARAGVAINPDLIVLHGGPSSPKYEPDAQQFLDDHGSVAHVLTRGEGEHLVCEVLAALAPTLPRLDVEALSAIEGLTYRTPDGGTQRTPDRSRITDLDALPSPYLTGEFDDIPIDRWLFCLSIETNRGCPYSCSYCDWGSSTLSRIRKFSVERVQREIEWAATRGAPSINLPDANFGIMSRDVEIAEVIADARRRTGAPALLSFYPAKNTTKHLVRIMDVLVEGGVGTTASISLQTTDEATLEAIDRSNISTDHYVALAASYRRRGFPIQGDLLIGLPGQTYASYRQDLQFNFDHEIQARTWQLKILPNAPMNDPAYRELHQIRSDDQHRVRSTSSFSATDRDRMIRLRDLDIVAERLGALRHVLRFVQWEHGHQASLVLDRILDLVDEDPGRWPQLTWMANSFEEHPTPPDGWSAAYDEFACFLAEEFDVPASTALTTALEVNEFVMPRRGRCFPDRLELAHDYVSYLRDATRSLYDDGHASGPPRPLASYPPASITVEADPLELCTVELRFARHVDDESMETDFSIGANSSNELLSPLTRLQPHLLTAGITVANLPPGAPSAQGLAMRDLDEPGAPRSVRVQVGSRP